MKLKKRLKAGVLLILILFSMAVPAACRGGAEVSVYSPEKFNSEESNLSAVESCESSDGYMGEVLSGEESVIVSGEIFHSFGWPPLTVRVDGKGYVNGTYQTIEEALKNAFAGEIIFVAPGVYTENLVVNSQVKIRAESGNPKDTVIRAKDPKAPVFRVTRGNMEISGFTVEGANGSIYPEKSSGIFLDGARDCTLVDNVFRNNSCAVFLKNSEDCSLRNNTVEHKHSYGILLEQAKGNLLENNTVRDSACSAILLQNSCGNKLNGNFVLDCLQGIGLNFSDRNLLCNNSISTNCGGGIELFSLACRLPGRDPGSDRGQAGIRENASENNTLKDNFVGSKLKWVLRAADNCSRGRENGWV